MRSDRVFFMFLLTAALTNLESTHAYDASFRVENNCGQHIYMTCASGEDQLGGYDMADGDSLGWPLTGYGWTLFWCDFTKDSLKMHQETWSAYLFNGGKDNPTQNPFIYQADLHWHVNNTGIYLYFLEDPPTLYKTWSS